jgi:acyl-coenzyme A synthetase/AMP-(fatty) acid ligase
MPTYIEKVIAFFAAHEGQWIDAIRFEQFGRQAWRTRISDARRRLVADGKGTIENRVLHLRNGSKRSQYRFVPAGKPQQMELPA